MKIKPLFSPTEKFTIQEYMIRCGVTDIKEFLKPTKKSLDNPIEYVNIKEGAEVLNGYKNNFL